MLGIVDDMEDSWGDMESHLSDMGKVWHLIKLHIDDQEQEITLLRRALSIATLTMPTPTAHEAIEWAKEAIKNGD